MSIPPKQLFTVMPVLIGAILLYANLFADEQTPANNTRHVIQLTINDAIGPAADDYIERALQYAARQHAELTVIQMDTPGGLDTAMRGIIKNITNSLVPVATYVSPTGSRAASAGTYILYASHVAAMAPGTNLGAATPVQIGGISPPSPKSPPQEDADREAPATSPAPKGESGADAGKQKAINDAVAYIRGLAQLHGRNQEWAEKAVREAASLPAEEALRLNVIDILAADLDDLLTQIDGREVTVLGQTRILHTAGATVETLEADWRSRFLSVITNPNIAYILMLVGIYGLLLEFSNPGAIIPGTIGAISLLLALYSFQLLPINYAGMALILLGIALMVGEAFEPSFGILGIGGLTAFVIGSIILLDTQAPGFVLELAIIITFAIVSAIVFIFVIGMAIKARRRPVVSGLEELVGAEAVATQDFERNGSVAIHSEHWKARSNIPVHKGQTVKVTGVKGLTLEVDATVNSTQEKTS